VYYNALGEFVHRFAAVEIAVHLVLRYYCKMSANVGKALLSGVRIDDARNRLNRLHEVKLISDPKWGILEPIFQQLLIINGARNDIIHYGASEVDTKTGFVTNEIMALTEERVSRFPISSEILDEMTEDLRKILPPLIR